MIDARAASVGSRRLSRSKWKPTESSARAAVQAQRDRYFDPVKRAAEKQASRDADARALASGEKTVAQLRAENSAFAFPRSRIIIDDATEIDHQPPKEKS